MVVCKKSMQNTALYLVNELINDVPQPLVGQLQRSRSISICIQTSSGNVHFEYCRRGAHKV